MVDYTSEDGLKILTYLRLTNLTQQEREVFREKWPEFYRGHGQDLIRTTWVLYSEALPFICGDGDRGSFVAAQIRDMEFGERLEESGLDKKLKDGTSLKDIFAASPERFASTN
ncbi:hypothetical protein J4422_02025 [Candidatus Pacearchaeota archaeon]|nr:hypothetical protein [Candidatus Pacearchaeota archaeon]